MRVKFYAMVLASLFISQKIGSTVEAFSLKQCKTDLALTISCETEKKAETADTNCAASDSICSPTKESWTSKEASTTSSDSIDDAVQKALEVFEPDQAKKAPA